MDLRLDGKTALVTGASRGIGLGIAATFAAAGAKVLLVSRKLEGLQRAADSIDGDVLVRAANVGNAEDARECVAHALDAFGRLDILVNNAAANPHYGPTIDISSDAFDKIIQVNLKGPLWWAREAYRQWMHEHPGVIINISSGGSAHVDPGLGVYNIAKAALNHLTRQLANELAPTRVVAIAPGLIDTNFSKVLVSTQGEALRAALPVRRIGTPQDVAGLALFVASEAGSYVTGETFFVDGGIGSLAITIG